MNLKNNTQNWPNSVRKSDLTIQFYRGSGPGGQNRKWIYNST